MPLSPLFPGPAILSSFTFRCFLFFNEESPRCELFFFKAREERFPEEKAKPPGVLLEEAKEEEGGLRGKDTIEGVLGSDGLEKEEEVEEDEEDKKREEKAFI